MNKTEVTMQIINVFSDVCDISDFEDDARVELMKIISEFEDSLYKKWTAALKIRLENM